MSDLMTAPFMLNFGVLTNSVKIIPDPDVEGKPEVLAESERSTSFMIAADAFMNSLFQQRGVNPDVFVAHKGYEELDKMLTMAAYSTPLRILFYAITFKGLNLLPAVESAKTEQKNGFQKGDYDKAMRHLESAWYHLYNIRNDVTGQATDPKQILWRMQWGMHHGFSLQEKHWKDVVNGPFKGQWGLAGTTYHRCQSIGFDLDPYTRGINAILNWPLSVPRNEPPGRRIPLEKCLLYTFEPTHNLPHGNGIARKLYKHYLLLDRALRDWAIQTKRAGGFIEGTSADPNKIPIMAANISAIESGGSFAHTEDEIYEVHPGMQGSMDFIGQFAEFQIATMTETILGTTMTTKESGKSSYAKSKVGQDTQSFIFSGPRRDLEFEFTAQVLYYLSLYNFGPQEVHLHPRLSLGTWDEEMRMLRAQIISEYIKNGVLSGVYDNSQIRRTENLWAFDETQAVEMPLDILPDRERVNIQEGPNGITDPNKAKGGATDG